MFSIILAFALSLASIQRTSAYGLNQVLQYSPNSVVSSPICVFYEPVTVILDDVKFSLFSCEVLSSEIIATLGTDPFNYEVLSDKTASQKRTIKAVSVVRKRNVVTQKIPYQTKITYTKSLPHKKKIVDIAGKNGLKKMIVDTIVFTDGTSKTKTIDSWVEVMAKPSEVRVGTKYDLFDIVLDGKPVRYWKTIKVLATSYDKNCYGCNDITATGAKLTKGIVAVDPRVIPLHTKMYVPGYGYGIAEDTGGRIKGQRIDLAFDDIHYGNWSKRWVSIYLID